MPKIRIAQKLGVYAKELGMGIEPRSSGDVSRKTPLFQYYMVITQKSLGRAWGISYSLV